MIYTEHPEIVLGAVAPEGVPELSISYTRSGKPFLGTVQNSIEVAAFIRSLFNEGEIELQEYFIVLYLNTAKRIVGYYRHTKGMIHATMADTRIILGTALKSLSTGIIVAHNHPSGKLQPSQADIEMTTKLKDACKYLQVELLDHLIVTTDGHYSFADSNMAGLERTVDKQADYIASVEYDLEHHSKQTKSSLERRAAQLHIHDQNTVKELTELAIVNVARRIALQSGVSIEEKYERLVHLYHEQVNLSHRTSQSILLQQYSTPAPIGYLMGVFCGIDTLQQRGGYAFEPSAGNGLLTVAAVPDRVYVNEVDALRRANLLRQGFANVWNRDGNKPFFDVQQHFMAVITNPPFGKLDKAVVVNGYPIDTLEHLMAIYALDTMTADGKAAIIIGGHTTWDGKGRIQAGKNRVFFNYLYRHYHVADVLQMSGKQLYSRQGTAFNTRLILIGGRKKIFSGAAPVYNAEKDKVIYSFDELFMRVNTAMQKTFTFSEEMNATSRPQHNKNSNDNMNSEAQRLLQALRGKTLGNSDTEDNQYAMAYTEYYLPLQDFYRGALILMHSGDYYEVYGRDAGLIKHFIPAVTVSTFLCDEMYIEHIALDAEQVTKLTSQLREMGIRFILTDDEEASYPVSREDVPLSEKHLWEISFADFLASEKQVYRELLADGTEYELPYKTEYVILFNTFLGANVYEAYPDNPYTATGRKHLSQPAFMENCLNIIHAYNIRLAMTMDIIVSEKVLADYPRMKLRQDARITYLKTLVYAGNQLNGIKQKFSALSKKTFSRLSKELKPLFQLPGKKTLQGNEDDDIVDHNALFEQYKKLKQDKADALYLLETPETFVTFNEDAEILAKTCNIGIIKVTEAGAFNYFITGSSKSLLFVRLAQLEDAGYKPVLVEDTRYHTSDLQERVDQELHKILRQIDKLKDEENLGAPYKPSSNACVVLDTQVPDSMAFETQEALATIKEAVGGDADNFVRDRLGYPTKTALCKALSAEQTDAVMMAIYNIEARGQGMIIGDQTGIGKGRVAAAMLRYAHHQGMKPVFLTEKANLFSDLYRDLYAIGSGHLRPFIINGRESKTDIKDEDGNIIYQALPYTEQAAVFKAEKLPAGFDFAIGTYSQFNSPDKKPEKPAFLNAISRDTVFIMDESHNSSGISNTGNFLQGVIAQARGVVYLSATFAKRPDNMPIYAVKTAISDCNMSRDQLVDAIQRGGVALQEVLSSQLVAEGQMIRRERSFEGVEVNYITLQDKAQEHAAIADNITGIVRDIISFQKDYIDAIVEELDTIAVAEGKAVNMRDGTSKAGVDNTPYFSKVFNIINQMLFSIKAASVAERAIERLKEGKKPVIAFSSTMGSFLEDMTDEKGLPVSDGSVIMPDFSEVLRRGLDGVMRYTERGANGEPVYRAFEVTELSPEAQTIYHSIRKRIDEIATGISISPIDVVIQKIKAAGYRVAEVTGRKYELQWLEPDDPLNDLLPEDIVVNKDGKSNGTVHKAIVALRKKINTNDAFREFNNNQVDVLLINQSGSTGASAHAIPTSKVKKEKVKQRVMIVLQAELDINTEVQKRGRINRTGQLLKPIYDYISSAIPAEMRLMMMLQKKLKSLDANTASNQKQSSKILDVPDFLNKYGDRVVKEYLLENPTINRMLDDPLRLKNTTDSEQGEVQLLENAAHKVSGRVAVLSVKMQQEFYAEITERYNDYVSYLQQIGDYDLEMEAMNLEAETVNSKIVKMGSGSGSVFSEDSILETVHANVLRKPFTATELDNLLKESLQGEDAQKIQQDIIRDYNEETAMAADIEARELNERYHELTKRIYLEKKFQRLKSDSEREQYYHEREKQIEDARQKALKQLLDKAAARKFYLEKLFRFFYIGRNLSFPINAGNGYMEYVPAVFLGFVIDWKRKHPFLPSKIKLRFALANSNKYFAMPASFDDIDKIIGASAELPQLGNEQMLHNWGTYIQQNNADRKTRHIVTGNLLQAFSDFRGKLVNYTTLDGKIEKGILLPENWVMDEQEQDKVSIPAIKALPLIKSITIGHSIVTTTGIGFVRQPANYKIIVPMSRKVAGDIYLDKDLLALVEGNNFNRVSDKMVAQVEFSAIERFVGIIQDKHTCSVMVSRHQFNQMEKQVVAQYRRRPIRMPSPETEFQPNDQELELLQLEAEALKLKLRLKLRLAA
ncbi:MAG: strawberry notch family protein [Bacteroidetes bacterium]|nr:strawberry notch family protein [Bacteroidota bacterium]